MPYEFGAIVLVPFPFTDQSASKKRPAVVVSDRAYNADKPDVVVMAVTSQLRAMAAAGEVWSSQWQPLWPLPAAHLGDEEEGWNVVMEDMSGERVPCAAVGRSGEAMHFSEEDINVTVCNVTVCPDSHGWICDGPLHSKA